MNLFEFAGALSAPPAFDSSRYPTAYAIDYVLAHPREFNREFGEALIPLTGVESHVRTIAMGAITVLAEKCGVSPDQAFTVLADAHLRASRIV